MTNAEDIIEILTEKVKLLEKLVERDKKSPVINKRIVYDYQQNEMYAKGNCPSCGELLTSHKRFFCNVCGQRLSWR